MELPQKKSGYEADIGVIGNNSSGIGVWNKNCSLAPLLAKKYTPSEPFKQLDVTNWQIFMFRVAIEE